MRRGIDSAVSPDYGNLAEIELGWLDAGQRVKRPQSAAAQARKIAGIVTSHLVLYLHIRAEQSLQRLR
jgi:hypothetical protein